MQIYLDEAHRDRRFTTQVNGYLYWGKGIKPRYKVYSQHAINCRFDPDYCGYPEDHLEAYTMTYDVLIKLER